MVDFLEHLPDLETVQAVIESAARVATDFLYISHPSFEGQAYLHHSGCASTGGTGGRPLVHPTVSDYCDIFQALGLRLYASRTRRPGGGLVAPVGIPVSAPATRVRYDPAVHPPKPQVRFDMPIWRAQAIRGPAAVRPVGARVDRHHGTPLAPRRSLLPWRSANGAPSTPPSRARWREYRDFMGEALTLGYRVTGLGEVALTGVAVDEPVLAPRDDVDHLPLRAADARHRERTGRTRHLVLPLAPRPTAGGGRRAGGGGGGRAALRDPEAAWRWRTESAAPTR